MLFFDNSDCFVHFFVHIANLRNSAHDSSVSIPDFAVNIINVKKKNYCGWGEI